MTNTQRLLSPAYEPGDGSCDGAQLVNGEWYHPVYGCDSLQVFIEQLPYKLTPEVINQVAEKHSMDVGDGYTTAIFDEEEFAQDLFNRVFIHEIT